MTHRLTERGFGIIVSTPYPGGGDPIRLVQESSAVGEYQDALDNPGSSFLWVGEHHHINREEVAELIGYLQCWLETGMLNVAASK